MSLSVITSSRGDMLLSGAGELHLRVEYVHDSEMLV